MTHIRELEAYVNDLADAITLRLQICPLNLSMPSLGFVVCSMCAWCGQRGRKHTSLSCCPLCLLALRQFSGDGSAVAAADGEPKGLNASSATSCRGGVSGASFFMSLGLSLLICKMGVIGERNPRTYVKCEGGAWHTVYLSVRSDVSHFIL